jgi:hypothetical protein
MTKQHPKFADLKPGLKVAIVALAVVLLCGLLDGYGSELPGLICAAAQHALVLLPSFVLTAAQTLQPDASSHQHFSACAFEMLVFWPLLQNAVRAE